MTLLIKKSYIFLQIACSIFLIFNTQLLQSQNIWDDASSLQYGKYLMNQRDYENAADEFRRYVYIHESNTDVVSLWIRSYAKSGKNQAALKELEKWNAKTDYAFNSLYEVERTWLLLRLQDYGQHAESLKHIPEDWKYRKLHQYSSIMLQGRWDIAEADL